jgi:hypothetical protein
VASLQARSPLRSAHPLFSINKLLSLTAFLLLLCVGWVALCYLKSQLTARTQGATETASPAKSTSARVADAGSTQTKQQTASVRLVYSCAGDKEYYHVATHLAQGCERLALSEDAALQRGLKHCGVCIPE